jgi:hypothetical protein
VRDEINRRVDGWIVEIERGGRDVVADRQDGEDGLDRASRSKEMADGGLGGGHRELAGRVPTRRSTAFSSISSPSGVEVPCALM